MWPLYPAPHFLRKTPDPRTLRLSFATADEDKIEAGIAKLAQAIRG